MVDDGSSDRAELHSALHNAGAGTHDREPIGRGVGCSCGRFWFGANACGAFGGCVRLGIGVSREAAKARWGAKGMGEVLDMINMIYMIFDGSGG